MYYPSPNAPYSHEVPTSHGNPEGNMTHRRVSETTSAATTASPAASSQAASPSTYAAAPSYTAAPAGYATTTSAYGYAAGASPTLSPLNTDNSNSRLLSSAKSKKGNISYSHNGIVATFWVSSLWCVLQGFESSTPVISCLCTGLALYTVDLANLRQVSLFGPWLAVFFMTMLSGWFVLVEDEDADGAGGGGIVLFYLVQIAVTALLFACGACWVSLQFEWLTHSTVASMEQTLHALLPLVASSICTVRLATLVETEYGRDVAGIVGPYIFALLMFVSMLSLGCVAQRGGSAKSPKNKHEHDGANGNSEKSGHNKKDVSFVLASPLAFGHIAILLVGPLAMHLATCMGRILSFYASTDDLYDIVLVASVPYLLQYAITWMHETSIRQSPYATPKLGNSRTILGVLRPMIVALLASLALQQRYLIALSHHLSYLFVGSKPPAWVISLYLTGATLCLIFTMSLWGRVSSTTNEPVFGEYHEDAVQLGLSLTGMLLGKGVGLPWNFTPLPVLAFLGLSLWFTTRMLRYLSIFLFVLHATGVVVFTYRFAGIEENVSLPVWGLQLSLIRFALVVVSSSIMIGLVTGISVRSSGGYGNTWIKTLDLGGIVFALYLLMLTALEISLLKRPVPTSELVGVMSDEAESDAMLYEPFWVYFTSALCIAISIFMQRVKIISGRTFGVVLSLALGKAVATYVDSMSGAESSKAKDGESLSVGAAVFWRSLVTAALCVMLCYPRFVLKPVYVKTAARYRRSLSNGAGNTQLPEGAGRIAVLYVFFILPLALVISVPYVLLPLAKAIKADFQGSAYYNVNPPASEVVGFALTLWGMASLFMLNYYLPDGGGEVWKKLAALGFLSGIGVFFAAPTLGFVGDAVSNPYASISSVGIQVVNRGKSRTGAWGLVAAGLATLLALTGSLELKERHTDSVRRDKYLLFRSMVFSVLFGGGVAWFIIMQSMSDAPWLVLLLTGLSCLAISFLGTISAVLGYFIELEDMEEVEQIFTIWLAALPIFLPVTGLPQLLNIESSRPFGVGGWLSTYLVICSAAGLAFAIALRCRHNKSPMTRGLGNLGVVLAWLFAICVLYGRYGVAGLDVNYDVTTVLGIPASVFGTFVLSLLLLALEGESSGRRSTAKRVAAHSKPKSSATSAFGLVLENLTPSNAWVPLVAGTGAVFVVASVYAVLLRGAGFLSFLGGSSVARSHEDVFTGVFGDKKDEHDLATLAEKAISHVKALATSAKLAGAGFWTAEGMLGPLLHLLGIAAVLPSLYLLVSHGWNKQKKVSSLVLFCLPLNAIPLILSRGIPSLQAAAILGLAGGLIQVLVDRQATHASRMRI